MVNHVDLPDSELHEPKHIQDALTSDAGKVITPSASTPGTSTLRYLLIQELSDGAQVVQLVEPQTLTEKRILPRVVALTEAANIACNGDTTDIGTVTLTANRIIDAPTGTPFECQGLSYRITQGGLGSFTLTWDAAFAFPGGTPPTLATAAGDVDFIHFRWNEDDGLWNLA